MNIGRPQRRDRRRAIGVYVKIYLSEDPDAGVITIPGRGGSSIKLIVQARIA